MQARREAKPTTYTSSQEKADAKILQLYPSLNVAGFSCSKEKTGAQQRLNCLYSIGCTKATSAPELAANLKLAGTQVRKTTAELTLIGLIRAEKKGRTTIYSLTTSGLVALMAFEEYRDWAKIKSALAVPQKRNDPLAYVLLLIGLCAKRPSGLYENLSRYAAEGNILENIPAEVSAESLLSFYRKQLRAKSPVPANYLSVFKEFTTAGFQEVFRMLLVAVKPTAEDYNWLFEFFSEVSEFYFDPARIAFVNLLPENRKLQQDLELFKKSLDQQIKKQDGNLEVTFTIPGSGLSKVDAMPPHLRAIGMRLILEPAKFINKELVDYFWGA